MSSAVEGDPPLCETREKPICVSPISDLLEEDASGDGSVPVDPGCGVIPLDTLGESSTWSRDGGGSSESPTMPPGVGTEDLEMLAVVESEELETDSAFTMEVSKVVGMSSDGQEKLKEECFKQILIKNQGIGGGSFLSSYQQEEVSLDWERVNSVVHEA